jgi:hypothetical protein
MKAILKEYSQKFDEYDKDNSKTISVDEFLELYRDFEEDPNKTKEEAQVVFDGIDINDDKTLSKEEFLNTVKYFKTNDKLNKFKLYFRSFDKDRSRTLEAEEIFEYFKFCGKPITLEQAKHFITQFNTRRKLTGLTFAQLYKLLTEIDIDPDTDPYDGKLPLKKNLCNFYTLLTCILLFALFFLPHLY